MEGWIKLHRKIQDNPISTKPVGFRVWVECLWQATYKNFKIDYCGKERTLKPGEFVFGRLEWSKRLKIAPSTINDWIYKLGERGMITRQVTRQGKATIYKIQNWNEYQNPDMTSNSKPTPSRHLADTNKKVKKDNNIKKEVLPKKINPLRLTRGQWESYLKEYPSLTLEEIKEQRIKCNNYMGMSSQEYTNPGLFFKGWLKRVEREKITAEAQSKKESFKGVPDISEDQRRRNIKRLSEIKSRFKGGVSK